jgi:hypothetical protein
VILVVAAWLAAAAGAVSPGLDDQLCPQSERISKEVLLILDATDPWSEVRKLAVRQEIEAISDSVDRFARITIHVVEPSLVPGATSRLTVCNPGSLEQIGDDARRRWVHRLLVSNEDIVSQYHSRFLGMVDSIVTEIGDVPEQASSPIVETVREAAMSSSGNGPFEIFLFSDMYQNSALFSVYRTPQWPVSLADSIADVYIQGTRSLANARISLFLLSPRDRVPDDTLLLRFWSRFFERQDAVLWRVERLEA